MQTLAQAQACCWRFDSAELKDTALVEKLVSSISREFTVASERKRDLELVLTEVVTNSIDHGILGLDSTVKKDPIGFEQYFISRAAKLAELTQGSIEISVEQSAADCIRISIQDSGPGFSYPTGELKQTPENLLLAYGRGLLIIQKLCESMTHIGNGNCVVLDFATQ